MTIQARWRRISTLVSTLSAVLALGASAQDAARARAQAALPPAVYQDVSALVADVQGQGVPAAPLYNKALEGMAKGVPPALLVPGIRAYAGRLGQARGALGPQASVALLVAGADALQRGVAIETLRSLPADRPRSPVALLVLSELVESGVPPDRAIAVLRQSMEARIRDQNMLRMSARVRRLIRDGVPPAEALDRVRRTIRRNRGGQLGPGLPTGDRVLDRRLLDRLRRTGGS